MRGGRIAGVLAWRPTGTGAAASVALAILVLAGVFIAVAVPRASLGYRTQVVQRIFHAAPSTADDGAGRCQPLRPESGAI